MSLAFLIEQHAVLDELPRQAAGSALGGAVERDSREDLAECVRALDEDSPAEPGNRPASGRREQREDDRVTSQVDAAIAGSGPPGGPGGPGGTSGPGDPSGPGHRTFIALALAGW
jgi:hypothetical protein